MKNILRKSGIHVVQLKYLVGGKVWAAVGQQMILIEDEHTKARVSFFMSSQEYLVFPFDEYFFVVYTNKSKDNTSAKTRDETAIYRIQKLDSAPEIQSRP